MTNRIPMLRVKIASLAAESRIIRQKENASRSRRLRSELSEHRRGIVRREARAAQLASGFLRGREYHQMEPACRPGNEPDFVRVWQLVEKYGACHDWQNESYRDWEQRCRQQLEDFVHWRTRAVSVPAEAPAA